jgi:glyoxylase-like metal-dependent hydrolase (beta-lactamase superfamily II)
LDPYAVKWIALTHAHWDHTGGIRDLTRAEVKLSRVELKAHWNLKGHVVNGAMPHHLAVPESRFTPFDFDGPPVLGFAASHDLFGDGSVVAVPTPGHTAGSTSYLVRGDDGKNWLFIGDATWTVEGVKRPAHKNPLVSAALDHDTKALAATLAQIHAVQVQRPEIVVVPAHDLAAFGQIPECADTGP